VKRNPQKPFIIYTKKLITQVLGTSFTIKANPDIEGKGHSKNREGISARTN
jgi:hypothetical protein